MRVPLRSTANVRPSSMATTRSISACACSEKRIVRVKRNDFIASFGCGGNDAGRCGARRIARLLRFAFSVRIALCLFLLLGCGRNVAPDPPAESSGTSTQRCVDEWKSVAEGIDYRMLNCELHLVRVDPKVTTIDAVVRPGSTAKDLANDWLFAINANFFDENFRPLGVVMSGGQTINRAHEVSWQSVFFVDRDGRADIVPAREWNDVASRAVTAAQCGPRLVVDGKRNEVARAEPASRSGVCIDREEKVIFFATSQDAMFDVWQMVELASSDLGCRDAMLFDGGPSVQLELRETASVEGDKRVPAYVVVAPRSQLKEGAKEDP